MDSAQFVYILLGAIAAVVLVTWFRAKSATSRDPLAEVTDPIEQADFHMAYGKYKEARNLIDAALADEPDNTTLQMKLLEICFVWDNGSEFEATATRYQESLVAGGEWEKVRLMGQQLLPDSELFGGGAEDA